MRNMYFAQALHQQELIIIHALQALIGQGAVLPMKIVSLLGSEAFIIAALPFIYWCIDRSQGARLGLLVMSSAFINLYCKQLLAWPRPFILDSTVGFAFEPTFGMPSGHSQLSVVFWLYLAPMLPKVLRVPLVAGLPLLVGFSRIFLGVHFPTDVLGGMILGILVYGAFMKVGAYVGPVLRKGGMRASLLAAAAVSLLMNALLPSDTSISGAFLGGSVGFALSGRHAVFDTNGTIVQKLLRYLAGILITLVLYAGPRALVQWAGLEQDQLIRFLRYGIIGVWAGFGAPFCFLRLKLARPLPEA
ncbi:MAG: phosphatase PAP2 family protein [Rectinemataceae bacterium]|nr:phosphatase PAP2 family protein [Spirochaetaceae bacterium]